MQRKNAGAHAGGRQEFPAFDLERLFERFHDPLDERHEVRFLGQRIQQEEKLVAADSRERVSRTDIVRHALCQRDEQRVSGRVAVVIVNLLEVVHVDEREREHAATPMLPYGSVHELRHQRAVRKTGELVVKSTVGELLFEVLALGDVEGSREKQGFLEDRDRLVGRKQRVLDVLHVRRMLHRCRCRTAQALRTRIAQQAQSRGVELRRLAHRRS